jgi:hypothetical protein
MQLNVHRFVCSFEVKGGRWSFRAMMRYRKIHDPEKRQKRSRRRAREIGFYCGSVESR